MSHLSEGADQCKSIHCQSTLLNALGWKQSETYFTVFRLLRRILSFSFNLSVSILETDSLAKTLLKHVTFDPDTALTGTTVQCIAQRTLSLLQPAALLSEVRQASRFTQQCCHLQLFYSFIFFGVFS